MKRSPLKRKTPLRNMSQKKRAMQPKYREALLAALDEQVRFVGWNFCLRCNKQYAPEQLQRHHPEGRIGDNLLQFKMICAACHRWIHDNSNQARRDGWIILTNKP